MRAAVPGRLFIGLWAAALAAAAAGWGSAHWSEMRSTRHSAPLTTLLTLRLVFIALTLDRRGYPDAPQALHLRRVRRRAERR